MAYLNKQDRRLAIYQEFERSDGRVFKTELNIRLAEENVRQVDTQEYELWRHYLYPIVARDQSFYQPLVVRGETLSHVGRELLQRARRGCIS
jgi:hypothetical protein